MHLQPNLTHHSGCYPCCSSSVLYFCVYLTSPDLETWHDLTSHWLCPPISEAQVRTFTHLWKLLSCGKFLLKDLYTVFSGVVCIERHMIIPAKWEWVHLVMLTPCNVQEQLLSYSASTFLTFFTLFATFDWQVFSCNHGDEDRSGTAWEQDEHWGLQEAAEPFPGDAWFSLLFNSFT